MTKRMYKSSHQRRIVFRGVKALLDLTDRYGRHISKETLNLICDRYCYVVDPEERSGEIEKYAQKEDDIEL